MRVANDNTETYERVLEGSLGYSNPSNVEYLLGKIGVSDTQPPSLMRGLQRWEDKLVVLLFFRRHTFHKLMSVAPFYQHLTLFWDSFTANISLRRTLPQLSERSSLHPGLLNGMPDILTFFAFWHLQQHVTKSLLAECLQNEWTGPDLSFFVNMSALQCKGWCGPLQIWPPCRSNEWI